MGDVLCKNAEYEDTNERRTYTKEYKANAVAFGLSDSRAIDATRDLGIEVLNLNRWTKLHLQELDIQHDDEGQSPSKMVAVLTALSRNLERPWS